MGIFLPFSLANIIQMIFHFDKYFYTTTILLSILEISLIYFGFSPFKLFLKEKKIKKERISAVVFFISLNVLSTLFLVVISASNL